MDKIYPQSDEDGDGCGYILFLMILGALIAVLLNN